MINEVEGTIRNFVEGFDTDTMSSRTTQFEQIFDEYTTGELVVNLQNERNRPAKPLCPQQRWTAWIVSEG